MTATATITPAAQTVPPIVTLDELTKEYGTRRAVNRLSFDMRPGTVTGFVGPNGAGKATTSACCSVWCAPATAGQMWAAPTCRGRAP
jgi:ABC-type multidrug transport system ATPase subunit